VVEATATVTILLYLAWLYSFGQRNQTIRVPGVVCSALTGVYVGVGTLFFFLLEQKGRTPFSRANDLGGRSGANGRNGDSLF
jgi:hypothetical protein